MSDWLCFAYFFQPGEEFGIVLPALIATVGCSFEAEIQLATPAIGAIRLGPMRCEAAEDRKTGVSLKSGLNGQPNRQQGRARLSELGRR